jgi:hypothetical protein
MKQLLTITLLLVVLSCGQNNSSKSDLLTTKCIINGGVQCKFVV